MVMLALAIGAAGFGASPRGAGGPRGASPHRRRWPRALDTGAFTTPRESREQAGRTGAASAGGSCRVVLVAEHGQVAGHVAVPEAGSQLAQSGGRPVPGAGPPGRGSGYCLTISLIVAVNVATAVFADGRAYLLVLHVPLLNFGSSPENTT